MKLLRYFTIAAAVGAALAAGSAARAADVPGAVPGPPLMAGSGPISGPVTMGGGGCATCGHGFGKHGKFFTGYTPQATTLFGGFNFLHKQKPQLPVFQAAPWYNYWPYDGHFLTPAPVSGPFYGPPLTGNFPVNPYFPGPAGAVGWGPIPGGPPPAPPGGGR